MKQRLSTLSRQKQVLFSAVFAAAIVLLYYGGNGSIRFSVDTYQILTHLREEAAMAAQLNGRFCTALLYTAFLHSGMTPEAMFWVSYGLGLVLLTVSVFLLTRIFLRFFRWPTACVLTAALLCCPAVLEYFLYFETASFLLSLLCVVLAFALVLRYFQTGKKRMLAGALLCLFPSIFSYQAITPGFVVLCLPFLIFFCGKRFGLFLKNNLLTAALYAIPNAAAFAYLHLFSAENRAQSIYTSLSEALYNAIHHTKEIWMGMFQVIVVPSFGSVYLKYRIHILLTVLLVLLSAAAAVHRFIKDRSAAGLAVRLFSIGYILVGCAALQFLFMLMGEMSLRLSLPLSMVNGSLAVNLFLNILERQKRSVWGILCLCLILVQCIGVAAGTHLAFREQYQVNALDKAEAEEVIAAITAYEQAASTEITNISIYFADSAPTPYPTRFPLFGLSRAMSVSWSDAAHISYYLGRDLEKLDNQPDIQAQFAQQQLPPGSPNQFLFTGDTVHICVY